MDFTEKAVCHLKRYFGRYHDLFFLLSELHGNSTMEKCQVCRKQYLRDFPVRNTQNSAKEHKTGRKCVLCNGDLCIIFCEFSLNISR
jgi:hypothetical protein